MSATKKFATFLLFVATVNGFAQTVLVKRDDQRVKSLTAYGFSTSIEATQQEVASAMMRYMKTFGKPKQQEMIIVTTETALDGELYSKPLYAMVKGSGTIATAWIGVSLDEWGADTTAIVRKLEGFVKSFGVNFYRDKIQVQIDEAKQAYEAVEKQQQRTQNENRNLMQRMENNKAEHAQLKRAIQTNRVDSVSLFLRIEKNKRSKDSLQVISEKVKHVVDLQIERQRKVN